MKYTFSIPEPSSGYIEIELTIENISTPEIFLQLPAWRPGRYETGNFARNVQRFSPADENGNALGYIKTAKDQWKIETGNSKKISVHYNYFAAQADAGGCCLNPEMLYVNPVHCCMFVPDRTDEACAITLDIPAGWKTACGQEVKENKFMTENFDELADSPFIASPSLQHHAYEASGIKFHIWMQGECRPDWQRMERDFSAFTGLQIQTFGSFPAEVFHFIVLALPYKFYHGVEHLKSTVIAIGPAHQLMEDELYNELAGVASHELFHAWNVKTIRPKEMMPYDFTKENYSQLGFVYEGFTTYYGDLFLARTGFFNTKQYLHEISVRLQKHTDNPGRGNYSVAQSSFDTWLDGYAPGAPGRKTSIYDEGSLIALMLDFLIRDYSTGKNSLDDVMRMHYENFGKKKKGYSGDDVRELCAKAAGKPLDDFFESYVYKASSYDSMLEQLLPLAGLEMIKTPSALKHESVFGLRTEGDAGKVIAVLPGSPAAKGGLMRDDEIAWVNGIKVESNLNALCESFGEGEVRMGIFRMKMYRELKLKRTAATFYDQYKIAAVEQPTKSQKAYLQAWLWRRD